jgi:hypothetical protein
MLPAYVREEDVENINSKVYNVTQPREEVEHYKANGMDLFLDTTSPEHAAVFYWCQGPAKQGDKRAATAAEYLRLGRERPALLISYPDILRSKE